MWPPIGWSFNGIADLNFGRAFFITGSGGTKRCSVPLKFYPGDQLCSLVGLYLLFLTCRSDVCLSDFSIHVFETRFASIIRQKLSNVFIFIFEMFKWIPWVATRQSGG